MKFEYRLNINDVKEANEVDAKTRIMKYYLIFTGVLILISLFPLLSQGHVSFQEILLSAILPNLLIVVVAYFATYVIRYFLIKRTWNSQPNLKNEISVETSDEELKITTPLSESKMQWSGYTHWRETPNLFMVYQSRNCLNMFPKRAFISDEQANEFRELLRAKLPNK
ncbi:YcxB family protein [Nostoc sp. C117]|uniref:YcxB family protein n=1 Tax=Nostoc sp. C117 TaxID=3349875 RepID=UPI00370D5C2F